jgi:hypothetical protein
MAGFAVTSEDPIIICRSSDPVDEAAQVNE